MSRKNIILLIQLAIWIIIFISPMHVLNQGYELNTKWLLRFSVPQLTLIIVFYANYLWIAPRYIVSGSTNIRFWLINILMIVVLGIATHYWMEWCLTSLADANIDRRHPRHHNEPGLLTLAFFIMRNMFNMAISTAIATMLVLIDRWQMSENARKEADNARIQAELGNLRSQINPHFLLNTLNNIYALTAFDSQRAQHAIEQLSTMLRYMLYDNQEPTVRLAREVEFLQNYISLMRIRMTDNVIVTFDIDIPDSCQICIAPLLFISLVENAFKHGVSSTEPSFIRLVLKADNNKIEFTAINSNYPKASADRSGHGIGLQQVKRRLELTYPGRYQWHTTLSNDNKEYSSKIIIYESQLCDNRR